MLSIHAVYFLACLAPSDVLKCCHKECVCIVVGGWSGGAILAGFIVALVGGLLGGGSTWCGLCELYWNQVGSLELVWDALKSTDYTHCVDMYWGSLGFISMLLDIHKYTEIGTGLRFAYNKI